MKTARAFLSLVLSAALSAPAAAQVKLAAEIAGSGSARISLTMPRATDVSLVMPAAAPELAPLAASASVEPAVESLAVAEPAGSASVAALARAQDGAVRSGADVRPGPSGEDSVASADRFWSGTEKREASAPSAVSAGFRSLFSRSRLNSFVPLAAAAPIAGAGDLAAKALAQVQALSPHAAEYAEGAAVIGVTLLLHRGLRKLLNVWASRHSGQGKDSHLVALCRTGLNVMLWLGALAATSMIADIPMPEAVPAAEGLAVGAFLAQRLSDWSAVFQEGLIFAYTRPFSIGDQITLDDKTGVFNDMTLTKLKFVDADGVPFSAGYDVAMGRVMVIEDAAAAKLAKAVVAAPIEGKYRGAAGAVLKSFDRYAAAAAALAAAVYGGMLKLPFLSTGIGETAAKLAFAGACVWLARGMERTLTSAVRLLAERNGWKLEHQVWANLVVRLLVVAGMTAAALNVIGVSFVTMAGGSTLTGFFVGLATTGLIKIFSQSLRLYEEKEWRDGDRLELVTNFTNDDSVSGTVAESTLSYTVVDIGNNRRAIVPHSVILANVQRGPIPPGVPMPPTLPVPPIPPPGTPQGPTQ